MKRQNCWEVMSCGREPGGSNAEKKGVCPAATPGEFDGVNGGLYAGRFCWTVAGTFCGGVPQGSDAQTFESCTTCRFFRQVDDEEFLKLGSTQSGTLTTHFATPQRVSDRELAAEVKIVSDNPVVLGLLTSVRGLLAILDENRQIVALNDTFLKMLGVHDIQQLLGLRPGEALHCIHAEEEPGGCGTSRFCSTCGAAVAIVASLGGSVPVERTCAATVLRDNRPVDIVLAVRSQPIDISKKRFLLILAQDITEDERRAALERTFFHDINNMLTGLLHASELLEETQPSEMTKLVAETAQRLHREIAIQHCLSKSNAGQYRPLWHACPVGQVLERLKPFFDHHPATRQKYIEVSPCTPDVCIITDVAALSRVLHNMVTNALEASEEHDCVKVWVETKEASVTFCVWNRTVIPPEIGLRIFKRNFSTKAQAGRGIGTYSMKLFGEEVLGGQVSFTSTAGQGTTFRFVHPIRKQTS